MYYYVKNHDGDGGTLESLHGINQHLRSKLEGVGIQSICCCPDLHSSVFSSITGKTYLH